MSCDVGRRHSSDLTLLRLWHRPAAVAPIGPLAWEAPYAEGASLKRKKKKKSISWEFPGGLVVRIWHFDHSSLGSIFGLGT